MGKLEANVAQGLSFRDISDLSCIHLKQNNKKYYPGKYTSMLSV